MKRKGFTLIELLAVIVVLAIIALIATPLVMNTIKNVKKGATERSTEGYIRGVKTMIMEEMVKGTVVVDGLYTVNGNGNLCKRGTECIDDNVYVIDTKGTKPTKGQVIIENKNVVGYTLMVDGEYIYGENFANGQEVYYNVSTGKKCNDYVETNSNTGTNFGCMKFYAFNDNGESDRVNLLLDHNTTARIAWNVSNTNANGPGATFKEQLANDTREWKAEELIEFTSTESGEKYHYKDPAKEYTITYSTNARLITANEIAIITGDTLWNSKTAKYFFYFDTYTNSPSPTCKSEDTSGCSYGWLYDRTSISCRTFGCLNNDSGISDMFGYWTASAYSASPSNAWYVTSSSYLSGHFANYASIGIRPVIEVLKSNF